MEAVVLDGELNLIAQSETGFELLISEGGEAEVITLDGDLNLDVHSDAEFELLIPESGEVGVITTLREGYPEYTGSTVVTPSRERQTLATAMKAVLSDIIIEPVPHNYGLISWDGSTLTVS